MSYSSFASLKIASSPLYFPKRSFRNVFEDDGDDNDHEVQTRQCRSKPLASTPQSLLQQSKFPSNEDLLRPSTSLAREKYEFENFSLFATKAKKMMASSAASL